MNENQHKTMRDVFIEGIYQHMKHDETIYFLSADCGAPALDALRTEFSDRFKSVGIAEQNLINIATGLALEGFTVFTYAIAPFLSMRAYEQIRTNLSLHSSLKTLNVNLIGIGAGLSYDLSGPTHHCLEDISLIRLLPYIELFSPGDWSITRRFLQYCLEVKQPKYLRFDSKPTPLIYTRDVESDFTKGFIPLVPGEHIGIISTGYMTHTALEVAHHLSQKGLKIGVIDLFLFRSLDKEALYAAIKDFSCVITLEEAFIFRGGMDSLIANLLIEHNNTQIQLTRLGIKDKHLFESGGREYLHTLYELDTSSIIRIIENLDI